MSCCQNTPSYTSCLCFQQVGMYPSYTPVPKHIISIYIYRYFMSLCQCAEIITLIIPFSQPLAGMIHHPCCFNGIKFSSACSMICGYFWWSIKATDFFRPGRPCWFQCLLMNHWKCHTIRGKFQIRIPVSSTRFDILK